MVAICASVGKAVFGLVVSKMRAMSFVLSPFGKGDPCDADQDRGTKNNSSDDSANAYTICRLRLRLKDGSWRGNICRGG